MATVRRTIAPPAVQASQRRISAQDFHYAAIVILIAVCCVAIEILAPAEWQPNATWLLLAPAGGLVVAGIPALIVARRSRRAEKTAREKDALIGLLLKDYAGERSDWIWSCDAEGRLKGVSQKFALQAGKTADSLEGTLLADLLRRGKGDHPDEITVCMRQRQSFYDLEATVMAGGECKWRMAGKPIFHDGRFEGYVGTAANVTSEAKARETMTYLAYHDGLTGLANRVHLQKRLAECVARFERYGTAFTLLLLDLDKFKAVNDTLGHQAGDRLLIEISKRLGAQVRKADLVARLGGDEFALLLPDESNPGNVANLATRLIQQICRPVPIDGKELSVGVSIGIAIAPTNGTKADQLVHNADLALYRAKGEGGASYCFFEARMDAEAHEQHELEIDLREAMEREEFVFHFEPQVAVADGRLAGLEALVRWNHPTRGLMLPAEFVPMAERTGLIDRIGEWKIFEACRALAQLPEHLTVAVNISPRQFTKGDVVAIIERASKEMKVSVHRFEIEITESLMIENSEAAIDGLTRLKALGASICMDHFGTGYSSLSCLRRFPFAKLKIDGSLATAASGQAEAGETVSAIIALAGALDITVACEGVETMEQAEFLGQAGAEMLQGEFLAKPMPLAEIMKIAGIGPAAAVSGTAPRRIEAMG